MDVIVGVNPINENFGIPTEEFTDKLYLKIE